MPTTEFVESFAGRGVPAPLDILCTLTNALVSVRAGSHV